VRVQDLLTQFLLRHRLFYDIDEAITAHGGEVHAYGRSKCSLSSGVHRLSPSYQPVASFKNMHETSTLAARRCMRGTRMRRAKKMDEATATVL